MKAKIFVASDIHGHEGILKKELEKAGFDPQNDNHLFVCCGDNLDRGTENAATLEYIQGLPNKVLVRGNHEDMLNKLLRRGYVDFVDIFNGTWNTVMEFFNENELLDGGIIKGGKAAKEKLYKFIDEMYDYFETENYIFVHGWIPLESEEDGTVRFVEKWRNMSKYDFEYSRWLKWDQLYTYGMRPKDKTLVCGHSSVEYASQFDSTRPQKCYDTFYGDGLIVLDTATVESKRINILVIEDELLESQTHSLELTKTQFDRLVSGKKNVELLLFDEKVRAMKSRDIIEISCDGEARKVRVQIKAVYSYTYAERAVEDFVQAQLGFSGKSKKYIAQYITRLYGEENIDKYGVAAVSMRLI